MFSVSVDIFYLSLQLDLQLQFKGVWRSTSSNIGMQTMHAAKTIDKNLVGNTDPYKIQAKTTDSTW